MISGIFDKFTAVFDQISICYAISVVFAYLDLIEFVSCNDFKHEEGLTLEHE